jgi:hypothetical protein
MERTRERVERYREGRKRKERRRGEGNSVERGRGESNVLLSLNCWVIIFMSPSLFLLRLCIFERDTECFINRSIKISEYI